MYKRQENAQKKVEGRNFSIRKYVLQYDNVMNKQREIVYSERRRVLDGEDLKEHVWSMAKELVDAHVDRTTADSRYPEEWDLAELEEALNRICSTLPEYVLDEQKINSLDIETLREDELERFSQAYELKEKEIGTERMRELERMLQ